MNKNTTLKKKLKSYSALAGTLVAGGTVEAQINYTDVNPDLNVVTGNSYNLDLNNDATVDFILGTAHGTYTASFGTIQYDYTIAVPGSSTNAIDTANTGGPTAHVLNDPISGSLLWEDSTSAAYQLMALAFAPPFNAYNTGNFLGQNDKYLGLKFRIGTSTHYGWVRVDVNAASTQFTVKDYGYEGTANTQILCGAQPATGVTENSLNNISVFGNANGINVNMNSVAVEGAIIVSDVTGKQLVSIPVTAASNIIPMENAASGVYFVTVVQNGNKITKKIFVK